MFEPVNYIVARIDGDYAYLKEPEKEDAAENCVARALLPMEIHEGSSLIYEMMEYRMA